MRGTIMAFLLGTVVTDLAAQTLRIQVVEETTGSPVEGAVVSLVTPRGRPVVRGFSDGFGRVTLSASAPGTWRLRGDRIGYATAQSDTLQLATGQTRNYRFVLPMSRVMLLELSVSAKSVCGRQREADPTMAAVWEEARKALVAVEATRGTSRLPFRLHAYALERDTDLGVSTWLGESTWVANSPRSFTAVPEATLRRFGFARVLGAHTWYYAPDDQVLLSDYFLDTHCFRSVSARSGTEELIGLEFTPRREGARTDVAGTIWLRRDDAALRHLDYSYTGLFAPAPGAGGRIEFGQLLPAGGWFVKRWCIRGPRWGGMLGRGAFRVSPVLIGYAEYGGDAEPVSPTSSSGSAAPEPRAPAGGAAPGTASTAAAGSRNSSPCSTG